MGEDYTGRWLTYRDPEAAMSARMHAQRRGWRHFAPNRAGGATHVLVPESVVVREGATHTDPVFDTPSNEPVQTHSDTKVQAHIEAHGLSPELIGRAVETLCDMVGWSSRRLEDLEKRLADAVAAGRIAANEAAGLRAELDRLQARSPWWRRWFR